MKTRYVKVRFCGSEKWEILALECDTADGNWGVSYSQSRKSGEELQETPERVCTTAHFFQICPTASDSLECAT